LIRSNNKEKKYQINAFIYSSIFNIPVFFFFVCFLSIKQFFVSFEIKHMSYPVLG